VWTYPAYARDGYVRAAAAPYEFHLALWELEQLGTRLPGLLREIARPPDASAPLATDEERAAVQAFFAAAEQWRQARARRAAEGELTALRAEWQAAGGPAQTAIARTLAVLAQREGLTTPTPFGAWLLPPASFVWSEPPRVLVVSPRDRIEVSQSVLLWPDVARAEVEALEQQVDSLGVSSLVVAIGGIATYPAIVPLQATPAETLAAVAHEWLHGYLILHPLGRAYFASYEARALNETVADLAGRELGAALAEAYGFAAGRPRRGEDGPPSPPMLGGEDEEGRRGFDFRRAMRETRVRLDGLLAAGQVAEAERYLEERRQVFVAAGYPIRKLNQAYFAFHGSYGESPAAVSPLDGQLRRLRARSDGLGSFLRLVGQMTSPAEVAAAVSAEEGGS
jgi:hypothetical protein